MKRWRAQLSNHGNGKYDFGSLLLLPSRPNNSTIVGKAKFWQKSFYSSVTPFIVGHWWNYISMRHRPLQFLLLFLFISSANTRNPFETWADGFKQK